MDIYISSYLDTSMIIIDKPTNDIFSIFESTSYNNYIFEHPKISKDGNDTKILAKYNKDATLSKYPNNDFINFIKTFFTIDDVFITIKQTIQFEKNAFKISQVWYVDHNHNDIIFATMLGNFKMLVEIEVSDYQSMSKVVFTKIKIIENDNFSSEQGKKEVQTIAMNHSNTTGKLKKISIHDYLSKYQELKNDFFQSDVKYSDNIILNILNIIVNNSVKHEYMRNMCEYFASMDVDIYSYD